MIASRFHAAMIAVVLADSFAWPLMAMGEDSPTRPEETEVAHCIRHASRGRSWLEKTLWGFRDQEGGSVGAEIPNTDGSIDLGPMQINSSWVERIAAATGRTRASVRWWLVHDACFNVEAARWIFLSGFVETGNYWRAVGVYHSPTAWRRGAYASSVARRLRKRFGPAVFSVR